MDFTALAPFDPPYESPIEEAFAWAVAKHLDTQVVWAKQVEKQTLCGPFRLDFAARLPDGFRLGLECDGKEFHDSGRDVWRDAALLGDDQVDAIIRVRGADIHHRMDDAAFLLAQTYPALFTPRGRDIITRLAAYFGEADQPFRSMAITQFARWRSVVSLEADHAFRRMPITAAGPEGQSVTGRVTVTS